MRSVWLVFGIWGCIATAKLIDSNGPIWAIACLSVLSGLAISLYDSRGKR